MSFLMPLAQIMGFILQNNTEGEVQINLGSKTFKVKSKAMSGLFLDPGTYNVQSGGAALADITLASGGGAPTVKTTSSPLAKQISVIDVIETVGKGPVGSTKLIEPESTVLLRA